MLIFLCRICVYLKPISQIWDFFLSFILVDEEGLSASHQVAMIIFVLFLGSWLPDFDWVFKSHRNPLTHSVLPFIVMKSYMHKFQSRWDKQLFVFFGYGLASHLGSDIIPGGNVVKIPAWLDMPFLAVNSILVFLWSVKIHRNLLNGDYSDFLKKKTSCTAKTVDS
jgi:hypothetical protein